MKKLRTAIIGCGNIAGGYDEVPGGAGTWTHAKAYREHGGYELIAAYDPRQERLKEFCTHWGVVNTAAGPEALLKSFRPEIVSICTPNSTHYDFLKMALQSPGIKGILCEKPLTLSPNEAREMVTLATTKGIPVLVNYLRRWDDLLIKIGEELRAGVYGTVSSGRVLYTKGVFHNASHAINLFQLWLGGVTSLSVERLIDRKGEDFLADFTLLFGGVPVSFRGLDHQSFNCFELELFTAKGRLRFPGGAALEFQHTEASKLVSGEFNLGPPQMQAATIAHSMKNVVADLYGAATEHSTLAMDITEAAETVEICARIREKIDD